MNLKGIFKSRKILGVYLLLFYTFFAEAQIPESAYQSMKYRLIGPFRGGRVTAVTGVPGETFNFYMGSTGGGVWETTDAGLTWQNISDDYFACASIGTIEVAPSDRNIIYVGTGSASARGNISPGCGIYKSMDKGKTWKQMGLEDAGQIAKIQIHPKNPDFVYAAVLGNIFGKSETRGIYRSTNGGINWERILYLNDTTGAIDLVMDPSNPRVIYAGMWRAERKPWTMIDGGDEGGLYKTIDGGETWNKITEGLPKGIVGRIGIAVSPVNTQKIWVIQEAKEESEGGIFSSNDAGKTWTKVNREHKLRQRAWYYSRIFADPKDENTVYVLNTSFYKSIDGGKTFENIPTPHGDNHCLWLNPDNPNIMIESNDGGANVSLNGGKTWTTQYNQPTAEIYRVTVDNQFPYRVYGAQQDNTTISVYSKSPGGVDPIQDWKVVGGGESGHIAVDPENPDVVYAGNYIGQIDRSDFTKGHSRNVVAYPQMHDGTAPRNIKYRFQWNAPIRISPHDPKILYHCSQYVHMSDNGGQSWKIISPDLTTNKDEYHDIPGGPVQHDHTGVELYTTIFSFEESPLEAGLLWVGSDDGLVHITKDGGKSWENITPENMPKEGTVNSIELSKHHPGRAFISVYKYRENNYKPFIFKTDDYGKTWKLITNEKSNFPQKHFVRVVREDPERKGLLYAGTEYGMYISFNDGEKWQPFQLNLPVTPITDMLIHNNDLVVATQGRSFWILDDLSPLREITDEVLAKELHLFKPRPAYRTQLRGYRGGDTAPDPIARGASIYFNVSYFDKGDTLKLSIEDKSGKTIKTFSTQPDKEADEEKLKVKDGLNLFYWDIKYPAPDILDDAYMSLAYTGGATAPPGEYFVSISYKGKKTEVKLQIIKDPRWTDISNEDLEIQFEFTQAVMEKLNETHDAIRSIRSVRDQVNEISKLAIKNGFADTLQASAEKITKKLDKLEKDLIQIQSESGQDPINYPPMLDDQFAYLYSVSNFQDTRPTEGSYERLEDLKSELKPHLENLEKIMEYDVENFVKLLQKEKVPRIIDKK
ncbi:VPS10 domain-containing protein [Chondrinema litorale]|uniref:VPS10 domain-containing protein n=1 Tax=Chondrinema litorale TaxID=2994555 RepID=UPI002543B340|nr:glycosyl hydrolase [Chondrinema litorale]UZR93622.1 glycosyl hydrolase [Chondrinema litorale]